MRNFIFLCLFSFLFITCSKEILKKEPIIDTSEEDAIDAAANNFNYDDSLYIDKSIYLSGSLDSGYIQANKNGVPWKSSSWCFIMKPPDSCLIALGGFTFNQDEFIREDLSFTCIPIVAKKYIPHQRVDKSKGFIHVNFGRLTAHGDVINKKFAKLRVDTTINTNYFRVLEIDTIANTIKARFDVSLVGFKDGKEERMRFTHGYLDVKISHH